MLEAIGKTPKFNMAQGWIVEGGDDEEELSQDYNITSEEIGTEVTRRNVRELDEEDFESEDETNDNENLTFDFEDYDQ
ncbi:hypothetical protein ACET3Z_011420 [Daucus carota]